MSLEMIGQLAIDLHQATHARKMAKYTLRDKYTEFCREEDLDSRDGLQFVSKYHPRYPDMQAFAKAEVDAYRRAQLDEYNLKRKLDRAVRRHLAPPAPSALDRKQIDMAEVWRAQQ